MTESNWLERFNEEVLPKIKSDFKPETVLLFGSYITGKANEDSDIDVIIVSKNFENIRFLDRMPLLIKKNRFPKHIDFICYTQVNSRE